MLFSHCIATIDTDYLGRPDIASLPEQSAMELLVSNIDDIKPFQDEHGSFKDINDWKGLEYTSDGSIQSVTWDYDVDAALVGDFFVIQPGGSFDIQWLPRKIVNFSIRELQMNGTVNTSCLPCCLKILDLQGNKFSGSFAIESLPSMVDLVFVGNNGFNGTLNISRLPRDIRFFDASNNAFSGSIELYSLPDALQQLDLSGNQFSGEINLKRIPPSIRNISLEGNKIQQSVLVVGDLPVNFENITVDVGKFREISAENGAQLNVSKRFSKLFIQRGK